MSKGGWFFLLITVTAELICIKFDKNVDYIHNCRSLFSTEVKQVLQARCCSQAIHYGIWHCFTFQQWGRAIKLLSRLQDERPSREVELRLIEAYTQLGWQHLADYVLRTLPIKYPAGYRIF